jgi:signal transduction histidine kinase
VFLGRPSRGALGLRGRIVGTVLVTTVATLAVAAVALLGPLETSLRNAESKTLSHQLGRTTIRSLEKLPLDRVLLSRVAVQSVLTEQQQLTGRTGATVVSMFAYPRADGSGSTVLLAPRDGSDDHGSYSDVLIAFRTHHSRYSFGSLDGTEVVRAAIPFVSGDLWYVLAVRKPIGEIVGAVAAVRGAFIKAGLAGLGLTLVLGIPLSATLVRRLRRLREAALELAREGPAVEVPVDRARDEVGDLARTLASMQQRLQEQEEARRSFVATASHELRTPLTSLDGMLELLDDDLRYDQPDLEDARALLDRARAQSRRLGRLAADLLDLSRLDAKVELRSEPVELGELGRAVMAEFELGTAEREVAMQLDDRGGPVWALGDPGSIARILRILLDNAMRISPHGSGLKIELGKDPSARVSVCDEGPGVAEEEREQIFRRFHRGRDTGGRAGFGLGLAIGRELAERMGGELILDDHDGAGATFTLRLPLAPPTAPAPPFVPARALSRTAGDDDEPSWRSS